MFILMTLKKQNPWKLLSIGLLGVMAIGLLAPVDAKPPEGTPGGPVADDLDCLVPCVDEAELTFDTATQAELNILDGTVAGLILDLASEATARADADTAETAARIAGDGSLQTQIDNIEQKLCPEEEIQVKLEGYETFSSTFPGEFMELVVCLDPSSPDLLPTNLIQGTYDITVLSNRMGETVFPDNCEGQTMSVTVSSPFSQWRVDCYNSSPFYHGQFIMYYPEDIKLTSIELQPPPIGGRGELSHSVDSFGIDWLGRVHEVSVIP